MAIDEVTLPEAARLRGVSVRTLELAAKRGVLRARRFGGKVWATRLADVDDWLAGADRRPGPNPGTGRGRPRHTAAPEGKT